MSSFSEKLFQILPAEQIRREEPMDVHTTFRVGGPADYFVEPADVGELAAVRELCRRENVPCEILGNGSNLLIADRGFRGVMISLKRGWSEIAVRGDGIQAGAAAMLAGVSRQAQRAGLAGLEFASGIPGTVGGAVVMNAGAYGSEMKAILTEVVVLTPEGEEKTLPVEKLELGYRTSCIPRNGYVVLGAGMKLMRSDPDVIAQKMEELAALRKAKQPLEYASAGSTFKRPEGYFAGKLIQDAGLRGFCIGGAQVSEKHCGFVINRGGAAAADIYRLCRQVQQNVKEQFGVTLEMEVKLLGTFDPGEEI